MIGPIQGGKDARSGAVHFTLKRPRDEVGAKPHGRAPVILTADIHPRAAHEPRTARTLMPPIRATRPPSALPSPQHASTQDLGTNLGCLAPSPKCNARPIFRPSKQTKPPTPRFCGLPIRLFQRQDHKDFHYPSGLVDRIQLRIVMLKSLRYCRSREGSWYPGICLVGMLFVLRHDGFN